MAEPSVAELCAKLRQDARDMREILAAWPERDIGNQNYRLFTRDVEFWERAADLLEQKS